MFTDQKWEFSSGVKYGEGNSFVFKFHQNEMQVFKHVGGEPEINSNKRIFNMGVQGPYANYKGERANAKLCP